jgi:predicted ArsR family transcriptional regulator
MTLADTYRLAGLERRAAQVLAALQEHGPSKKMELEDRTGISWNTVRVALARLERLSLVSHTKIRQEGRGRPYALWSAVSVDAASEVLLREHRERDAVLRESLRELRNPPPPH